MFHSARLQLTAWYLLIIMLVSISFSAVIYRAANNEIERFSQRVQMVRRLRSENIFPSTPTPPPEIDSEMLEETRKNILETLILINASIFILSGGLGFFLAERTLRPIQDMVLEQNRFVSDASHELRTPLTALKSSLEVFLRDKHANMEEAKQLIHDSLDDVNRLESLSDSLLLLAQYKKTNKTNFSSVPLNATIDKACKQVAPLAKEKQIKISTDIGNQVVLGDRDSLIDFFVILIENAVKYSAKKSSINIRAKKKDGQISVSIQDEGIGISEKDVPHIFDRFYRADNTRSSSNTKGYGLGLSIAKRIVEMHHGSIHAESKLGKGTTFTVKLPIVSNS